MTSTFRVTKEGELREVEATVQIAIGAFKDPFKATVTGVVQEHRLKPLLHIESPLGDRELQLDAVDVPAHHSMLSPLQPWNRLNHVRPNQRWQITLFDPLSDSISAALPGFGGRTRTLEAGVRESSEDDYLFDKKNRKIPCIVIEYRGEDQKALTWIRESDGLVLRQEAIRNEKTPQEERLVLERELP